MIIIKFALWSSSLWDWEQEWEGKKIDGWIGVQVLEKLYDEFGDVQFSWEGQRVPLRRNQNWISAMIKKKTKEEKEREKYLFKKFRLESYFTY